MITIDLRKGFGEFEEYEAFKFPDNSIKFKLKYDYFGEEGVVVKVAFKSSDDLFLLAMVKDVFDRKKMKCSLVIDYMMYQQDDRRFDDAESFGLKVVSNFINSLKFNTVKIFSPHSDKVEFIDNCYIIDNTTFLKTVWGDFGLSNAVWVIPDSGAFKTQFKQIEKFRHEEFVVCNKSRDITTNKITTVVNVDDLKGKDCFIVDDICLGGNTFINIAKELQKKNCGNLYLIVSHGVFNNGIEHLKPYFKKVITTTSICTLPENDFLKLYTISIK